MEQNSNLSLALAYLCLGVLFICEQGGVLYTALIITTVALFALALVDLINKKLVEGLIKLCLAVLSALFTWVPSLNSAAYYLLAALFIIVGVYLIYVVSKSNKTKGEGQAILSYTLPLLSIVAGVLFFFNVSWAYIVIGVVLALAGLINLYLGTNLANKKK